jgi:hypothetical protein
VSTDAKAALFVMLGQTATRAVQSLPEVAPPEGLLLSPSYDLATLLPDRVKRAQRAARTYEFLFVFEGYLREFVVDTLGKSGTTEWWSKIPKDVQEEVAKLEETEEIKGWMALGSRDKSALLTYPQLLRIIDVLWKTDFEDLIGDKTLIHEARVISHLRNTICHMTEISDEEDGRIRQTMLEWFRVVAP